MTLRISLLVLTVLATAAVTWAANPPAAAGLVTLKAVPFTDVQIRDEFWAPRIETGRTCSLPHNFKWCRQTGRFSNFAKAGKLMEGKFEGIYFNDSDVYKVLEGAGYSLHAHPDADLDKQTDEVIAWIAAAQQPDGYLNTFYTLKEPGNRWTDLPVKHELYCAGHLFEAAVAHWRATGKRTLLDVAIRYADYIASIFGPDKRHGVPRGDRACAGQAQPGYRRPQVPGPGEVFPGHPRAGIREAAEDQRPEQPGPRAGDRAVGADRPRRAGDVPVFRHGGRSGRDGR